MPLASPSEGSPQCNDRKPLALRDPVKRFFIPISSHRWRDAVFPGRMIMGLDPREVDGRTERTLGLVEGTRQGVLPPLPLTSRPVSGHLCRRAWYLFFTLMTCANPVADQTSLRLFGIAPVAFPHRWRGGNVIFAYCVKSYLCACVRSHRIYLEQKITDLWGR